MWERRSDKGIEGGRKRLIGEYVEKYMEMERVIKKRVPGRGAEAALFLVGVSRGEVIKK
jgi:hypothetical protein